MIFDAPVDRKHLLVMDDAERDGLFTLAGGLTFRVYAKYYRHYLSQDGKRWVRKVEDAGAWALGKAYKIGEHDVVDASIEYHVVKQL